MSANLLPSEIRARDRYGWRPSKARPCPLAVLGRHCQLPSRGTCEVCQPWQLSALRRSRVWLTGDGQRVLTGEAWDVTRERVQMALALYSLGLEVVGADPGTGLVEPRAALVIVVPAGREGP
ncbi:MAG: hypothetical protein ACRDPQ_14050 [Nocardioidaceae bacterium]